MHQLWRTTPAPVALTGKVGGPAFQVSCRRKTNSHVLPVNLQDAEVAGVQMQIDGGVVVLPDAAALPLAQRLTAKHGCCSHIGDVWVEGRSQVLGQRLTGSLQGYKEFSK